MTAAPRGRTALLSIALALLAACAGPSPSPSGSSEASPTMTAGPSVPASGDPSVSPPSASLGGTTYVVVGGDTLFSIARAWQQYRTRI